MVIFDCNGVLVDGEKIANSVLAEAFTAAGLPVTADVIARKFHGRRQADIFHSVESATRKRLPIGFSTAVADEILRRFRTQLHPVAHSARALTWVRGPKAVASSSSFARIQTSLELTGLISFFSQRLFSASAVVRGKPAPDIFLHAAGRMEVDPARCIVVEDSAAGVGAAAAAGMTPIGFVGGSEAPERLANDLGRAGARAVIGDLRALHGAIVELRGW